MNVTRVTDCYMANVVNVPRVAYCHLACITKVPRIQTVIWPVL